jgi:hypothetical protein
MRPTYLLVLASIMATGFSDVPRRSADFMQHMLDEFGRYSHDHSTAAAATRSSDEHGGSPMHLVGPDGVILPRVLVPARLPGGRLEAQAPSRTDDGSPLVFYEPRPVPKPVSPAALAGSRRYQALVHALKMRDWQHSVDHGALCITRYDVTDVSRWLPSHEMSSLQSTLKSYVSDVAALRRSLARCTIGTSSRRLDIGTLNRIIAFERREDGVAVLYIM